MAIRVAINGFGRIGRLVFRQAFGDPDFELVAINDITDAPTLAHLLKYDSVHGRCGPARCRDRRRHRGGRQAGQGDAPSRIPSTLPWKELGVDLVLESTGRFTKGEQAKAHIDAGARWVVISAPGQGRRPHRGLRRQPHPARPGQAHHRLQRLLHHQLPGPGGQGACKEQFGIVNGLLTTIHSYTNDQKILDLPAQGPAPGPGRRRVDDPDLDRRRQGHGRGLPGAQGQAGRHRRARTHPGRLAWWTSRSPPRSR